MRRARLKVDPLRREQVLAMELIEDIGTYDDVEILEGDGGLVPLIAEAFARYRVELGSQMAQRDRFAEERIQELEKRIAELTKG